MSGMAKKTSFDDLPEDIIQYIQSFLPENYAAKTSILSKGLLSAWRTKPTLYFDCEPWIFFENLEEKEERRKKFSKYVKRILNRYTEQNIKIETLKLDAGIFGDYSPIGSVLVKRCTIFAEETGVKTLHLFANCELPEIIFEANSLVDLRLRGLNMLHLSTENIMWHSLKRLCFLFVLFDGVMFDNIISSCPLLEIVEISHCTANVDDELGNRVQFKVNEHHNLKKLNVRLHASQRLILAEAPKLESLICTNEEDYLLLGSWLPCGLSLHYSSQYQNLKMLHLCGVGITDDFFNNMEQKFPNLKDLLVRNCQNLRRIKISSQTLQRVQLEVNYKLEDAQFDVPSIDILDFICDEYCEIIPVFSFSTATKGHWISRIYWRQNVNSSWLFQLKKFLVNLIPSKIFLDIAIGGSIELDMDEIRNSLIFPEPQELQELSLRLSPGLDSSFVLSALDGFFSICRPNSISLYWVDTHENDPFMKLVFDMLMSRTNQDKHHKLQQMKCWQHDLRQVQVQIYDCGVLRTIGNATVYFKKGLVDQQPEALDWESILKALRTRGATESMIYFMLNWEKHSMSKRNKKGDEIVSAKRCKRIKQSCLHC